MTISPIARDHFTILRTPPELAWYVQETYDFIAKDQGLRECARLHKEPFKTFLEELMPFSHFCTWKYLSRSYVLCALVSDTSGKPCAMMAVDKTSGQGFAMLFDAEKKVIWKAP